MEISQLKDYVAYAEERVVQDEEANKKAAEKKMKKMAPDQVKGAMKEYLNWKYKKQGKEHRYAL